ncbi:MAG: M28 family metallopeptidase [Pseudomonadota bacterium]
MRQVLRPEVRNARAWLGGLSAALLLASCGGGGNPVANADLRSVACGARANNTVDKLVECVTLEGVRAHQAALQAIANDNNGHRASGTSGYDDSVDYAQQVFEAAGYSVTRQAFQFQTFIALSPSVLTQTAPGPATAVAHRLMEYSGSGDVTASVSTLSGPLGCVASDFAGFPAGNIALISRGTCTFADKATHAANAGAVGVIVYNNVAGDLNGTLGDTFTLNIGVVAVTQSIGQQLASTAGLAMRIQTDTFRGQATAVNLLAESRAGDPNNVVMVGAHLDSVDAGPGINDNGSGVAAILETAVQMARVRPNNKLRFALWGAEEASLAGSTYYVANLTQAERLRIALYLNFDMIGSPNHVFFVYDGDNSDNEGQPAGPAGSAEIEKVFENFYTARGIPFKGTDLSGRSDYGPFMAQGVNIPVGGLFTGAEGTKTAAEAALFGGTAGAAYDPCYHQACDTYANNSNTALDVNADAVAHATVFFAMNTGPVNAQRGRGNANRAALQWPEHPPAER